MRRVGFDARERIAQAQFFEAFPPDALLTGSTYRLRAAHRHLNLAPMIREWAEGYFGPPRNITWHQHANHGLSSQVCCLNFLMPLATEPEQLSVVIGNALNIPPPVMLPFEDGPNGTPWYVGFEWIGRQDHLSEWPTTGRATRGANATSADAVVRFRHEGQNQTVLIEWKYTESYGTPLDPSGNPTRIARYSDKVFAPNGPIRNDLGLKVEDFFWEPLYQLLRQQMLAWRMERAREDDADRVSVLHISPAANTAVRKVTAPALQRFGDNVFEVFRSILVQPANFRSCATEELFRSTLAAPLDKPAVQAWAAYLRDRYTFLLAG